ncbi:MAG: hypothetical protein WKF63_06630 [Thermomicrobiales bacterium]
MTSGEHLIIADIEFLDAPNVVPAIFSFSEREHIYRRHPEMVDREHAIVQTFRTPGMVIRDTVHRDTLNYFAEFGSRHHILVSVELGRYPYAGRVKRSRIQRMSRTFKMRMKAVMSLGSEAVVVEHWGK